MGTQKQFREFSCRLLSRTLRPLCLTFTPRVALWVVVSLRAWHFEVVRWWSFTLVSAWIATRKMRPLGRLVFIGFTARAGVSDVNRHPLLLQVNGHLMLFLFNVDREQSSTFLFKKGRRRNPLLGTGAPQLCLLKTNQLLDV